MGFWELSDSTQAPGPDRHSAVQADIDTSRKKKKKKSMEPFGVHSPSSLRDVRALIRSSLEVGDVAPVRKQEPRSVAALVQAPSLRGHRRP